MTAPAVEARGLTKRFGHITAVDDLSFSVAPGEVVGLLGPNGAGKTTTVKMLTGLALPTQGAALIAGHDLAREPLEAKRLLSFIPDRPHLYEKLTGREYLRFIAGLFRPDGGADRDMEHGRRIQELLALFELDRWQDELIESYSHGMRQKLVFTGALSHQPQVLIVDEPMVGLDPKGARIIKELLKGLADKGVGLLLSTHSMELVERLCHRIIILRQGRILAEGSVDDLRKAAQAPGSHLEDIFLHLTGSAELKDILSVL